MWISPTIADRRASGLAAAQPTRSWWPRRARGVGAAPALASWLSRPLRPSRRACATPTDLFLRTVARRTWRFFETFVTPADNDLPPDNFQEDPPQGVAHRTSPTNIGLALTANLAAYDFGYLSVAGLIDRTTRTLAAMDRMQRHRGHFYNWYDTRTLEPLRPIYISTVDSGNLAGHLLTLAAGLQELADHPIFRAELFAGLCDALDLLAERSADPPMRSPRSPGCATWRARAPRRCRARRPCSRSCRGRRGARGTRPDPTPRRCTGWNAWSPTVATPPTSSRTRPRGRRCRPRRRRPSSPRCSITWAHRGRHPTLADAARLAHTLVPAIDRSQAVRAARPGPRVARRAALRGPAGGRARRGPPVRAAPAGRALRGVRRVDVEFLYDRERHLLAIGYNVGEHRLDASHYDLLASEARLASFVAIAQGKLPQEHWFALGRRLTAPAASRRCCRGAARCSST
jgi:cyclic beta-1,2-glucan synthetase